MIGLIILAVVVVLGTIGLLLVKAKPRSGNRGVLSGQQSRGSAFTGAGEIARRKGQLDRGVISENTAMRSKQVSNRVH